MLSRPDVGTKEHIQLWLTTHDENEQYEWLSAVCPAARYAEEFDVPITELNWLNDLAQIWPQTWGSLAERAQ